MIQQTHIYMATQCQQLQNEEQCPSLFVVLHLRHPEQKATSVPYSQQTFKHSCAVLFQHRSLAYTIRRISTAVFSHRPVAWETGEQSSSTGKHLLVFNSSREKALKLT